MRTLSISLRAGGSRQEGRLRGAEREHGGSFTDKLSRRRSPPVLSTPCPGLVWLGPRQLCCLPLPCTTCPICSLLSSATVCAKSQMKMPYQRPAWPQNPSPPGWQGKKFLSGRPFAPRGQRPPQALCGFTRESLVPALPPRLHPLRLPLPQGSRAGTAGATSTPPTHTCKAVCQPGGTLVTDVL